MITTYPEKASLKEVFTLNFSAYAIKNLCKENGVFLLSPDKDTLVRDAHLFYWGFEEINKISNFMDEEKNYKKSFRLKLSYTQVDADDDCFDALYSALAAYRNTIASQERITFDSFHLSNDNDQKVLTGEVSYERNKPGKVELLRSVTQHFSFTVQKGSDSTLNIDFIFNDRWDISVAKKIISTAIATSEKFDDPAQISLKTLSVPERVELFDRFFRYMFADWRLETIQSIKISDEEAPSEDDEDDLEGSILNGIQSALLSGTGLRSNPIVIQAVDRGYFFPKATVMFEHKRNAEKILVDFAFNTDDLLLEINMIGTYEIEENRAYKRPMLPDDQAEILHDFHDIMQKIYKEIVDERSKETVTS